MNKINFRLIIYAWLRTLASKFWGSKNMALGVKTAKMCIGETPEPNLGLYSLYVHYALFEWYVAIYIDKCQYFTK